jgi:hypothetical protein
VGEIMKDHKRNVQLFNTPLEVGIRAIILLSELEPEYCDMQRLVYYDYLLLHSEDVEGGPPSIHPPVPYRSCEILVRRELMYKGLLLMQSKELIHTEFGAGGIVYRSTKLSKPFLSYFASEYAMLLKQRAEWVIKKFSCYNDGALENYIRENLNQWGSEFAKESLVRGEFSDW